MRRRVKWSTQSLTTSKGQSQDSDSGCKVCAFNHHDLLPPSDCPLLKGPGPKLSCVLLRIPLSLESMTCHILSLEHAKISPISEKQLPPTPLLLGSPPQMKAGDLVPKRNCFQAWLCSCPHNSFHLFTVFSSIKWWDHTALHSSIGSFIHWLHIRQSCLYFLSSRSSSSNG